MAKQISFTPAALEAAICVRIHDPATAGLILETLPSGRKRWQFRRRLRGSATTVKMNLGTFPIHSIADARAWAAELNEHVDAGRDPREVLRQEEERARMTVSRAHELYMAAVREGRASRAKRPNKPRTISDKQEIFDRDIAPRLGSRNIYDVTEAELVRLVAAKGKTARIRANRLAAELKGFFGWTASLRGMEVGLEVDPSRRLGDLRFPESPRSRSLGQDEIGWFLQAVAEEERDLQRGMLLWLLTAARLAEVLEARRDELSDRVWVLPAARTKNGVEHRIPLGPWGWTLMQTNSDWIFPAPKLDGPRSANCWYKARNRVRSAWRRLRDGRSSGSPRTIFGAPRGRTPNGYRSTTRPQRQCSTT